MTPKSPPQLKNDQGDEKTTKKRTRRFLRVKNRERCIGCFLCMLTCARTRTKEWSGEKSAIRVQINTAGDGTFAIRVCRGCTDAPCALACPKSALKQQPGGGVVLVKSKCNGCGNCRDACAIHAVHWDEDENRPMICIHCGNCIEFCPHKVLELQEVEI